MFVFLQELLLLFLRRPMRRCSLCLCPWPPLLIGSRGEYLVGSAPPCPRLEARELEAEVLEGLRAREGRLELRLLLR